MSNCCKSKSQEYFFPTFLQFMYLTVIFAVVYAIIYDFSGGSDSKESACYAGDPGSIPGWEDPLEKRMATHSSILAQKIPWTEESGATVHGVTQAWAWLSD